MLRESKDAGWIDNIEWQSMDRNLDELMDAQGGTERIKNTPLPKQYDYFPTLFIQIYCLVLPIGMVEQLGWFTPLGSTLVGFMFLALDKIGRDLENPFDNTIFDVPMTAIATTIETNLRQLLGETVLPEAIKPIRGVLCSSRNCPDACAANARKPPANGGFDLQTARRLVPERGVRAVLLHHLVVESQDQKRCGPLPDKESVVALAAP